MITVEIPGPPPHWRRARVRVVGRFARHFTDGRTRDDEAHVADAFATAPPCPAGPLEVEIVAYWPRPKRCPAWADRAAWRAGGPLPRPVAPDADNTAKATLDGLQARGWLDDDARVTVLIVRQRVAGAGEEPRTVVSVRTG